MTKGWIPLVALGLLVLAWRDATAHTLPNFPQVRLLAVGVRREEPLLVAIRFDMHRFLVVPTEAAMR